MPRIPRGHAPDTIYHVVSRGVERRIIYLSDSDRQLFLASLSIAFRRYRCSLHAYCLMGNHFHLLASVTDIELGRPLRDALTRYSLAFNMRHERTGHLFQGRYYATPCHDLAYIHHVVAYIHLNPVRAGLVTKPEEWRWSSHEDWTTPSQTTVDFERLSILTAMQPQDLKDAYLYRLEALRASTQKLSLDELIRDTATIVGILSSDLIMGRRGALYARARQILIDRAIKEGYSLTDLARALGCTKAALSMARRRRS